MTRLTKIGKDVERHFCLRISITDYIEHSVHVWSMIILETPLREFSKPFFIFLTSEKLRPQVQNFMGCAVASEKALEELHY